jgi:hypothetical protein
MAYEKLTCLEPELSIQDVFRLVYLVYDTNSINTGIVKGIKVIFV